MDAQVRLENKIAKTESVNLPEKETTTSSTMPAPQPESQEQPLTNQASSSDSAHQSMIVNPPSSYFRAVAHASSSATSNSLSFGVKRKSDVGSELNASRLKKETPQLQL